jgi:hypothetical protein
MPFSQNVLIKLTERELHFRLQEFLQINYLSVYGGISMELVIIVRVHHSKRYPKQQSLATAQKWNQKPFFRCNGLPEFHRHILLATTLVARLLPSAIAQKLWRYEQGVFMCRTCFHSRTLIRIEISCCCSCSIWVPSPGSIAYGNNIDVISLFAYNVVDSDFKVR